VIEDKRVHVYTWDGSMLTEKLVLPESEGTVTALAVSSDGALIVQGNVSVQNTDSLPITNIAADSLPGRSRYINLRLAR